MKKEWVSIEIACGSELSDDLAAAVAEAFGVGVEITGSGVRFYLEGNYLIREREAELEGLLEELSKWSHAESRLTYTVSPLYQEDWADRWKVHFKPLRVGAHFLICPTWEEPTPGAEDRVIWMDPGRAFGTGHHESTRLCLEWLEDFALSRERVIPFSLLDVGTGSGILAVAAALLGFERVRGIDNDPEAVEVARENIALNGLASVIQLQEGTAAASSDRFDIIIANIQALPLIGMAEDLVYRLKSPGILVMSGILVEQKEAVAEAFRRLGGRLVTSRVSGEWCLLDLHYGGGE